MIWLGASGWQYKDWRPGFYPAGMPLRAWLAEYARAFATVEVNNAFYRLPEHSTFVSWREQVSDDFLFAVKMSRYLTHIRRLRDPEEPVARFLGRAEGLGSRLGPVLLQLPPNLRADATILASALAQFPASVRVAVEPRHPSWWQPSIKDVLEAHNASLCWADRRSRPITPLWRTADWGYLRMHEGAARPSPRYGRKALSTWVNRVAQTFESGDVFVYFNNDSGGAAITDAVAFGELAERAGHAVTRFPSRRTTSAPYARR